MEATPTLFVFAGLPGSGKSTLAKMLGKELQATFLRIDTIEQALRDLCDVTVEGEGYGLGYRLAFDNLKLGNHVVADSCNPITLTRDLWNNVAKDVGCLSINIEVICSDASEHRHRVESRKAEVSGLALPTWEQVEHREYHEWQFDRIVIDTAAESPAESFLKLKKQISVD